MHQDAWWLQRCFSLFEQECAYSCLLLFTHTLLFLQPGWLTLGNLHLSVPCLWQLPATLFTHQNPPLASKNKFLAESTSFSKHLTNDWNFLSLSSGHRVCRNKLCQFTFFFLFTARSYICTKTRLLTHFWSPLSQQNLPRSGKKLNGFQLCIAKT